MKEQWQAYATRALESQSELPSMVLAKRTPLRAQTIESEVLTPLFRALITGVLILLGVLCTTLLILIWLPAGFISGLFWLIIWFVWGWSVLDGQRLLWQVEEATGLDIDQDGQKGQPETPKSLHIEIHEEDSEGYEKWVFPTLACPSHELLKSYLQDVLTGEAQLSERGAAGYGFTRESYWLPFRDELLSQGWARWKNPSAKEQGVDITDEGNKYLTEIAYSS